MPETNAEKRNWSLRSRPFRRMEPAKSGKSRLVVCLLPTLRIPLSKVEKQAVFSLSIGYLQQAGHC
jgi:hypothetical protein